MPPYVEALRRRVGTDLLLMPSVSAALFDEAGRLLLAQQAGTLDWMTIGGGIDPGESPADAATREVWEETGLHVEPVRLLGVFGGRDYRVIYANGDQAAYVVTLFEVRHVGGTALPDGEEAVALRYVTVEEAQALPMSTITRLLVERAFARSQPPAFDPATWRPPT